MRRNQLVLHYTNNLHTTVGGAIPYLKSESIQISVIYVPTCLSLWRQWLNTNMSIKSHNHYMQGERAVHSPETPWRFFIDQNMICCYSLVSADCFFSLPVSSWRNPYNTFYTCRKQKTLWKILLQILQKECKSLMFKRWRAEPQEHKILVALLLKATYLIQKVSWILVEG